MKKLEVVDQTIIASMMAYEFGRISKPDDVLTLHDYINIFMVITPDFLGKCPINTHGIGQRVRSFLHQKNLNQLLEDKVQIDNPELLLQDDNIVYAFTVMKIAYHLAKINRKTNCTLAMAREFINDAGKFLSKVHNQFDIEEQVQNYVKNYKFK